MATSNVVRVPSSSAHSFVTAVLAKYHIPPDRADLITDSLVLADLRGVDTYGINRLGGRHAPLDAKNTFGFVAASLAIDKGVEMAQRYGVGVVAVKHSNHYGMAATYLLRAMKKGCAVMAFTNATRSMPPWDAKEPLLGTSPFAVGVPGGQTGDFIRKAARRGEKIPEGYALDGEGRPTTDPEAALAGGVVLPIGGPKGSGLALMMDLFGGLISGAAFAGGVNDQYKNLEEPQNVGHWFLVFQPEIFLKGGSAELKERMDILLERVRQCERAAGVERIYTSGEIEAEIEAKRRAEGIHLFFLSVL
ncbi:Malate/L-lactate dehydrogenase [Aspergillus tetrazonus]